VSKHAVLLAFAIAEPIVWQHAIARDISHFAAKALPAGRTLSTLNQPVAPRNHGKLLPKAEKPLPKRRKTSDSGVARLKPAATGEGSPMTKWIR
jgi:hypothetical protein